MIIYKATNLINGMIYVGQTTKTLEERKKGHEKDAIRQDRPTVRFHNALLYYGYDNFKWEVLQECSTQEELDYWEDYYIKELNCLDKKVGYNLKSGGKLGVVYTDEVKQKIGQHTKEVWKDPEKAARMREGLRKGTETCKQKAALNFEIRKCPICGNEFKVKPYDKKQYCSHECVVKANHELCIDNIKKGVETQKAKYFTLKEEQINKSIIWVKEHKSYFKDMKLNKLGFLSELGEYLGVKDMRTISKYFDVNGRKELALKLAEYANSENIC